MCKVARMELTAQIQLAAILAGTGIAGAALAALVEPRVVHRRARRGWKRACEAMDRRLDR